MIDFWFAFAMLEGRHFESDESEEAGYIFAA